MYLSVNAAIPRFDIFFNLVVRGRGPLWEESWGSGKKDGFVILPTRFGKSLIYKLLSIPLSDPNLLLE